jgi:DNA adenine methylase
MEKIQIDPIIKWPGGKRRQARQLISMMPEHDCFVEVFFGGGGLFFSRAKRPACEVINDINTELINMYFVVKSDIEALINELDWSITARALFQMHKTADLAQLTPVQRAARFLYLQNHSFGAKVAGQTFGTDTTGRAPNLVALISKLRAAHTRLNGVYIENLPWQDCIKRYDRPHTLFYLDPPYWQLAGYGVSFGWEQYAQIANLMMEAKGKVMLSINDHPDIVGLFRDFRGASVQVRYSNGNGKSKLSTELIYCNF